MQDETERMLSGEHEDPLLINDRPLDPANSASWSNSSKRKKKEQKRPLILRILIAVAREWVMIGIVAAAVLAYFFAEFGSKEGPLHVEILNMVLIGLVFTVIGLCMDTQKLKDAGLNWKSHLAIQSTVFILSPLLFNGVTHLIAVFTPEALFPVAMALGIIITGSLPSTFDTCTIFARTVGADEAIAVINGTLSNLMGILVTPLLLYIQLHSSISIQAIAATLLRLVEICLAPFILGQLIRILLFWRDQLAHPVVRTLLHWLPITPKIVLIWLTYTTFCTTFVAQTATLTFRVIAFAVGMLFIIHFLMLGLICLYLFGFTRLGWALTRAEMVSHLLVGSEKTMTLAIGIIQILYSGHPDLAVILIPVIAYHSIETLVEGILIFPMRSWIAKEKEQARTPATDKL